MYRIELENAYLPKYLEKVEFTSLADATSVLGSVLETLRDTGKQITGNVVDDDNKSVVTNSVNKPEKYTVYVRIGGWAAQTVTANSKEEAETIAIAHPEKWGMADYNWWYDESGCGGYEGIEGVYPKELQILNVEREGE